MPDYSDQYPDYFSRVKQAKAGPFLPKRVARVRISAVRPNDKFIVWLYNQSRCNEELERFYMEHVGYLPIGWKQGSWGWVRHE